MNRDHNTHPRNSVERELDALREQGLSRSLRTIPRAGGSFACEGRICLNFSSNDYLGFSHHPRLIEASRHALETYGTGSGASRLVTGDLPIHQDLEAALARHKGYPASLLFGSGYMTNCGVIASLCSSDWTVVADRQIHASVIDAVRLSGARLVRFHHNDPEDLARRLKKVDRPDQTLVVTESVFSMDGDLAPLPDLADCCEAIGAFFLVDEAHATGVFGPRGQGLIATHHLQSKVHFSMSTFSKALGTYGGAVACSEVMRRWMIHKARAFIYTTAPPPVTVAASLEALRLLDEDPDLGMILQAKAHRLRDRLQAGGADTLASASQIIPVLVGDNHQAVAIDRQLREQGILAVALRPPTVAPGTARLRLSVSLDHTNDQIDQVAEAVLAALRGEAG